MLLIRLKQTKPIANPSFNGERQTKCRSARTISLSMHCTALHATALPALLPTIAVVAGMALEAARARVRAAKAEMRAESEGLTKQAVSPSVGTGILRDAASARTSQVTATHGCEL